MDNQVYQVIVEYMSSGKPAWHSPLYASHEAYTAYALLAGPVYYDPPSSIKGVYLTRHGVVMAQARRDKEISQ